ncbi:MAG: acyl carrier protein [Acidiferrobacterales bacterium]|nr:acyl carrier protein [Acidiferrobacterales bacterium]
MSHSEEEIYRHTKTLMVELFEIEEDKISMQSNLYEDLDIDSIDAVDLMVELKNLTGVKIEQEAFREVKTMEDVVRTVHGIMNTPVVATA